ncbi:putative transcriptional regulator, TetR family protein [Acidocella aquatica]|uniref:Transcriptional regulator, TetR family protein n=1 Tax=Acidocella aquatica TaxID=1922313 RepID=A0ABQ6A426_9PROT|nr:TetR/AcrR family transcriptional regulator [Acidocella aquatica]GLR66103.1 putative transcriptional regulator, TetR family protein [Acidocella aquatica]
MDSPPAPQKRKGGPRRDLMERELLDCAAELFAEKGFSGTSLQDIANAAGVGRTTLYHYFGSKDDFLTALVEDVTVAASSELRKLTHEPGASFQAQLLKAAETLVTRQLARAVRFKVLDREENHLPAPLFERHQAGKREVLAKISGLIKSGIRAGEFRPVDANIAALSFIGMCNWTAWWFNPAANKSAAEVAAIVAGLGVASLLNQNAPSGSATPHEIVTGIRSELDRLDQLLTGTGSRN